jgi:hypothetical protein
MNIANRKLRMQFDNQPFSSWPEFNNLLIPELFLIGY